MDSAMAVDVAAVDVDFLQLPQVPAEPGKCDPFKGHIEEIFSQWLSLPETEQLVMSLVEDAMAGIPLNAPSSSAASLSVSTPLLPSMFPAAPPLSPRTGSGSFFSPRLSNRRTGAGPGSLSSALKRASEPANENIPQFYFPNGPTPSKEIVDEFLKEIDCYFLSHSDGLHFSEFVPLTKEICKLPSFFSTSLFKKVDTENSGRVTRDQFVHYWLDRNLLSMDLTTKVFNLLKQTNKNFLTQEDFRPIVKELLATHRGLEFLQNALEFQERYAETVIYRIFYYVNRSGNGRITLRDLKRTNLIAAMQQVDDEEDINKVLRYFSYEHFYVIYCKFWELDTDHDFLLDKEDLLRYGNHSLTYRVVQRIFSQAPRKFTSKVGGKMGYEDFVCFMLSEEDKSSEPSIEYWFKCVDLDCNGVITPNEMQFFYEEQLHRMECMGHEPVPFEDILCQIVDMIGPKKQCHLTLHDLQHCKLSGNFFNILFNLNKFVAFETRDPFLIHQERELPALTEWDRFAHQEYVRLSMEEDGENVSNGSIEVWEDSIEEGGIAGKGSDVEMVIYANQHW